MSTKPVRIAVTGAAGQINYNLLFRIASGGLLGQNTPVILQLLELPTAMKALFGVVMELEDGAFPLLAGIEMSDQAKTAFKDADYAFLVGSKPRGPGMERADLLQANAGIFVEQGKALSDAAKPTVRVLVVGNPANTNALIAQHHARPIPARQIHAMMRLDHHRALFKLAQHLGAPLGSVDRVTVWGNHSTTQYPDIAQARLNGKPLPTVDKAWVENTFVPAVQKRGAEVIAARGASSAASAANAALMHMRDWALGTPEGSWVSMGVPSDGSYGVPEGVVFGFPCECKNGDYRIVQNLTLDALAQQKIKLSYEELLAEREAVSNHLA